MPPELRAEMTREAARGHQAWVEARKASDFDRFLPALRRNVELKLRYIDCFEPSDSPYDHLLDDYEPGMKTAEVKEVFDVLRPALTELVAAAPEVDASFLDGALPDRRAARLRRGGAADARLRGRRDAPRPDRAPVLHLVLEPRRAADDALPGPTTSSRSGRRCTRRGTACTRTATTRRSCARRSPVAPSLGLNESQSRTWENLVGRQRPFWTFWYERLQARFPSLGAVDLDAFLRAINRAEPGLIRVDADETTYSLHIILRFELEQEIIDGPHPRSRTCPRRGTRA